MAFAEETTAVQKMLEYREGVDAIIGVIILLEWTVQIALNDVQPSTPTILGQVIIPLDAMELCWVNSAKSLQPLEASAVMCSTVE
jgi:hypothetical protein